MYTGKRPAGTKGSGQAGKCLPHAAANPVGDDACIVPGTLRRRKVRGRAMALPYKPGVTPG